MEPTSGEYDYNQGLFMNTILWGLFVSLTLSISLTGLGEREKGLATILLFACRKGLHD